MFSFAAPKFDWLAARLMAIQVVCIAAFTASSVAAAEAEFPPQQLFTQHCAKCHSDVDTKGDFAIAGLADDFTDKQNREQWLVVLERLKEGSMPPEDEPRPPAEELQSAIDWIGKQAAKAESARRKTEGRVVMRRLNRAEYANTVRDLLGVSGDDINPFLARVKTKLDQNYSFEQAMRVGLKGVLVAPNFLFLREPAPKLDDYLPVSPCPVKVPAVYRGLARANLLRCLEGERTMESARLAGCFTMCAMRRAMRHAPEM